MDRAVAQDQYPSAVRPTWGKPQRFVLHTGGAERGGSPGDEAYRRAIHADAVLRFSANDGPSEDAWYRSQPQAGAAFDAADGARGHLPEAAPVRELPAAQGVSLLAARGRREQSGPGVEYGYNLHPVAAWICVLGGDPGLVQPVRAHVAVIEHAGCGVLPGGAGGCAERTTTAGDFQQRSRGAVYKPGFHGPVGAGCDPDQHGWAWARVRQYLHGAAVAKRQVRRGLHKKLRRRAGSTAGLKSVLSILQPRASAPGTGLSDTGSGIFRDGEFKGGGGVLSGTNQVGENKCPQVYNSNSQVMSLLPDPPHQHLSTTTILISDRQGDSVPLKSPGRKANNASKTPYSLIPYVKTFLVLTMGSTIFYAVSALQLSRNSLVLVDNTNNKKVYL